MTVTAERLGYRDAMRLDWPEREVDGARIRYIDIGDQEAQWANLRAALGGMGRDRIRPGRYTGLYISGMLWMSDTPDEMRDHCEPFRMAQALGGRVLINGLGLGMVTKACLMLENVEHVDVVEIEDRVIELIQPLLVQRFGTERLTVHHDDAYTIRWPTGMRWTVAWHDVWPTISEDNLQGMARLNRRYGRRVGWQGCWAQHECRRMRREWG